VPWPEHSVLYIRAGDPGPVFEAVEEFFLLNRPHAPGHATREPQYVRFTLTSVWVIPEPDGTIPPGKPPLIAAMVTQLDRDRLKVEFSTTEQGSQEIDDYIERAKARLRRDWDEDPRSSNTAVVTTSTQPPTPPAADLTDQEKTVKERYFEEQQTAKRVAATMGVTVGHVRNIATRLRKAGYERRKSAG
jgi:hypothetical protein